MDTLKRPEVIFEDNQIIVAVKPAGVLSQADDSGMPDMLTMLKAYIKEKYNKPGNVYLGLLHRLDRPVSGVMVFARTSKAASRISDQIRKREMTKIYRAVVEGEMEETEGRLENWCTKDGKHNITTVSDRPLNSESKKAALRYRLIDRAEYKGKMISLIKVELETGRSHQIRAQMAHCGHPLLGDAKYGTGLYKGDICLQSCLIGFKHPVKNEYIEFEMPLQMEGPWASFA